MILDSQLSFVPVGAPLSLVTAGTQNIASNVLDGLGVGVGQPPPNIIGNASLFGADLGVGGLTPFIEAVLGAACTGGTSLNVALQAAPDTGAAGGFLPGTWTIIEETGPITVAGGTLTLGQILARFVFSPSYPANQRPRYYRLLFQVVGAMTGGNVAYAIVTMVRDDQANKNATKNFTVS